MNEDLKKKLNSLDRNWSSEIITEKNERNEIDTLKVRITLILDEFSVPTTRMGIAAVARALKVSMVDGADPKYNRSKALQEAFETAIQRAADQF